MCIRDSQCTYTDNCYMLDLAIGKKEFRLLLLYMRSDDFGYPKLGFQVHTYVPEINPRNWYPDQLLLTIVLSKKASIGSNVTSN